MTGFGSRVVEDELPDFGGQQSCLSVDPELFFPDQGGLEQSRADELSDLCGECPVRDACLEYALAHNVSGIWAGTTTAQRRTLRRRSGVTINAQQQRLARARRTVADLTGRGLTSEQIIAQTGIHEQTVYRVRRQLDPMGRVA